MFERYTEKARRSIFFARYEASQFGSPVIDTEHLLLGLLREDKALADRVLGKGAQVGSASLPEEVAEAEKQIRATVHQMENAIARHEFEKARLCSDQERVERENLRKLREKYDLDVNEFDSDAVRAIRARIEAVAARGERIATSADLPLSHPCKRVLAYGAEESQRLHHQHIGTEHLLTGLAREEKCLAAQILRDHGLTAEKLRESLGASQPVEELPRRARSRPLSGELLHGLYGMFSHPEAARFYRSASAAAAKMGSPCIETKHLLAVVLENTGEAFFGASAAAIRQQITPEPPRREKVSTLVPQPTDEFQRAFSYAMEEAALMGDKEIGAGHLVLGLLREESCEAAEILRANGLSLDRVRRALAASSGSEGEPGGRNYV